jgi:hypothetical protein
MGHHDLNWGVNVKTLQRWRAEGRRPRFMKIGRTVTYLPKDIEHFETYSLYESGRGGAVVDLPSPYMEAQSPNRSVTLPRPRTPKQEIVDLLAGALLHLRAAGPPPKHPLPNLTVNEVEKDDLARRRVDMRVLTQMTGRVDGEKTRRVSKSGKWLPSATNLS